MNQQALNERYPNGIPSQLQEGVNFFENLSQKSGVKSVTLMSNFGLDLERSLDSQTNIYKGLIVQVSSQYELSESDKAWFHPEIAKARSLYNKTSTDGHIGRFNSTAGVYSTYHVDELGGQETAEYTIVDTTVPEIAETTVNHWIISHSNMRDVYTDYKTNKMEGKTLQKASQAVRDAIGGEPLMTSEYVSLFKGASSYHFYNHAIKSDGEALVLQSSLMGYSKVDKKGDVAADALGEFMDISSLKESHLKRVYNNCKWDSDSMVNTQVMRKGDAVTGTAYRMVEARFSSNDINHLLDATTALRLTPTVSELPEGIEADEYTKKNMIPFAMDDEIAQKVMQQHWKTLISSKYIQDGKLVLPRAIVEQSLI